MIERQIFQVSTDTGTWGDTGPHFFGEIAQVRWNPTTVDTGADLRLDLLPKDGDTGDGWTVYNDNDCLGANFTKVPTQPQAHSDGADTGASLDVPVVAAGDRLRVKVTPGGAEVAGRLYVYTRK